MIIKELTEEINGIPELQKALASVGIPTELAIAIIMILLITAFASLVVSGTALIRYFEIFERAGRRRIEMLDTYALAEAGDADMLKTVSDARDSHYFRAATGIYAESKLRKALIHLHDKTSQTIIWIHIRRALAYIEVDETGAAFVRPLKRTELAEKRFYSFFWYFFLAIFALSFGFAFIYGALGGREGRVILLFVGFGLLGTFMAVLMTYQLWPFEASAQILKELEKSQLVDPASNTDFTG